MSMTTSLWNFWRNSVATRAAWTTASGSSPLTWKMGASTISAMWGGEGGGRGGPGAAAAGGDRGLGGGAVDVEDGRLDHQRDVGRIGGRARVGGRRREADL